VGGEIAGSPGAVVMLVVVAAGVAAGVLLLHLKLRRGRPKSLRKGAEGGVCTSSTVGLVSVEK
jgi:hypothetical protein